MDLHLLSPFPSLPSVLPFFTPHSLLVPLTLLPPTLLLASSPIPSSSSPYLPKLPIEKIHYQMRKTRYTVGAFYLQC